MKGIYGGAFFNDFHTVNKVYVSGCFYPGRLRINVMLDIMLASYIIFIVTSLWDTVIQIVAKKTCQKSNILFKEVDG